MTPEQNATFVELTRLLRRPGPLHALLREVTEKLAHLVVFDSIRYDIADERDAMWSRICRLNADPERPPLGTLLGLKSKETLVREGDELSIPLGFGERPSGKLLLRRKGGFTDADVDVLRHCADLFTLALRHRPLDAKPRPRGPFEELSELL